MLVWIVTQIHDDEAIPWTAVRVTHEPINQKLRALFICSNFCAKFLRECLMDVRKFSEIPERLDHILQKEKQLLSQRAYKQKPFI